MASQPALFYQGKYQQLLEDLEKIQGPSMQEIHNLAIVKFLALGENPLPALESISEQIMRENPNESWPTHPSWNLLCYHICLYHFCVGNYDECHEWLKKLWANSDNADRLIVLCTALISIELFIRNGDDSFNEKAQAFLQMHFSNTEAVTSFLSAKVNDDAFVTRISNNVQYATLRASVAKAASLPIEEGKPALEAAIELVNVTQDMKNRTLLPVKKVIPIACAALCLDELNKYTALLEACEEQDNFAILNNRGIYELLQKRYSSALLHFSKALDARHNNAVVYPYHQVIYNIGLSLLMRKKARKAFKFLHSIIPLMSNSPYLWLRLSECCVLFYKQRVTKLRQRTQQSPVIARTLTTGTRSFIILPQTDFKLYSKYPLEGSGYVSDLNLEFAEKCSRNAIALCTRDELEGVKHSAELVCAFVSLELGDGKRAADMGKAASAKTVDSQRQFLAKIYSAQGNSMMGEHSEARGILSRLMIESNKVREKESLVVHSVTLALVSMALQDMKKAQDQLANAQKSAPNRPEVILTKVAFELNNRKPQNAIEILSQYNSM